MRILITGALGHIGSRLLRDLPATYPGADILLVDNLSTQRFPSLFDLPPTARYCFIEADVTKADLAPLFKGVDVVVHLAAMTDAAGSVDRAAAVEANNFRATQQVAHACAEAGVRLIHLSSTSVYGKADGIVAEDCTPSELNPQSPYAETKLKEEALVQSLAAGKCLKAIICRFGTIFGTSPGMRFHTAVNKFCWQAVMGQPLTVWRTAYDQKRPYLDLVDACRAIAHIIQHDLFDGRIYNVLTLNATVRQIVEAIADSNSNSNLKIEFVDNRIMNQLSYEVSRCRFEEKGFVFSGELRRGIGETLALLRGANSR